MGVLPFHKPHSTILTVTLAMAAPLVYAASGKRLASADFGESPATSATRQAGATLQSGAPQSFRLPVVSQPTLFTGVNAYLIAVPAGATKLEIQLVSSTPGVDVDLYVRAGADPDLVNGQVQAEFRAEGESGDESIIIDSAGWISSTEPRRSTPVLQAGNYHIAFGLRTLSTAVNATITATITGGNPQQPPPTQPPSVDLTGTWNWTASCPGATTTGQMQIQQTGASINGSFLGSEQGTLSGTVQANQFTFTRTWSTGSQTWTGTAGSSIGGQLTMQGNLTGTGGPCSFSGTIATAGGGTGTGGGGSTSSPLTVVITQEDNSECPAHKKVVASVTDSSGQAVLALGPSNFTVTEGSQMLQVDSVVCTSSGGSAAAGSVAIVIDRSGSLSSADLSAEKAAAKALVDQLPSTDAIAVYSFGSTVTLQQAFTTDKAAAKAAIDAISGGGNTLLYQAIIDASNALSSRSGRRAVVVMTDGVNSGSSPSDQDAINAAKTAAAPVFTVGFGSGINQTVLQKIATDTGGVFLRGADSSSLTQLLGRIGTVLTSQCTVSYVPSNPANPASITLTASDTAGGAQRTGSTTRTVTACAAPGGGNNGGGSGGSTTQPGCDYFVRPLEYSFGQAGGTAGGSAPANTTFNPPVLVTTRPECRWGSVANDAWITIEAGQSGQGDGAVSYRVAANSTGSARTGAVTIAGRTHTVRQAAGSSCSYTITPIGATISSSGGFGSIDVSATASDCPWMAVPQADWISLNSGQRSAAGVGNGSVTFAAGPNPNASTRTGTILIAGQTFTVTQNPTGTTAAPSIPGNGVVPAGSGTPPSLPGGAIAQGSFFTVFAYDVGPVNPEQATAYPLPTNLGGTEVFLRQGSTEVSAYIVFTSRSQINGIIPSNTPLGDVDMIVAFNGRRSNAVRIRVVRNNFNIFTTRAGAGPGIITNFVSQTNQPLNTRSTTAEPGQVVTIWGNGGGPIAAADNIAPPVGNLPFDFEVHVGGKPQKLLYYGRSSCCSALDQVVIELTADVPMGCAVPVQVRSGGSGAPWSNVATMAISKGGAACTDQGNPVSSLPQSGGAIGAVLLVQGRALIPLKTNAAPESVSADLGLAAFMTLPAGGALGFNSFTSFPPVGSCQAFAGNQDLSSLLGGGLPGLNNGPGGTQLDAGNEITVTSPSGRAVKLARTDDTASTGPYAGLLGGSIPFPGLTPGPAFLEAGTFGVSGTGGKDVGAFNATATFPALVTWTNRDQITSISRGQGVLLEWSGGGSDDRVLILGGATDQKTKAGAGFLCVAAGTDRRFQVPPSAMSNMPMTRGAALEDSFGILGIASLSLGGISPFTASGLDMGLVVPGTLDLRTVAVQ
ncbi:MAG: VWA domain-containing protein [Bryobacteraceae bacterium]